MILYLNHSTTQNLKYGINAIKEHNIMFISFFPKPLVSGNLDDLEVNTSIA